VQNNTNQKLQLQLIDITGVSNYCNNL
jgi:hypothetical protein